MATRMGSVMSPIELLIVIVIIGILAAVAIPKYHDITVDANRIACSGSLDRLRNTIIVHYANQAVTTGTASWPTHAELITPGIVLDSLPLNPFQGQENAPDSVVLGIMKGATYGHRGGWVYNPNTGEVWPNTSVIGENNW